MKMRLSISLRLTLWFSAIFLCSSALFSVFLWFDLGVTLSRGRDQTLARRAGRIVDLLQHAGGMPSAILQKRYEEFVEATPEGKLIQVFTLGGTRILPRRYETSTAFPWPAVPSTAKEFRVDTWFNGRPYRVYCRLATLDDQAVRVYVAGNLSDNRGLLAHVTEVLERTIPIMLLISGLVGYFISRRALMPVARLTSSARSITIGNLAARLPVSPVGDELARLAETCNEMLTRLEEAVTRITQFTADASHELRSPLALIRNTCEFALKTPELDPDAASAFSSILTETKHSARLLEDMLLLARFDAGRALYTIEPVSISEIVRGAVDRLQPLTKEKNQQLSARVDDEDLEMPGDVSMLRRLVSILIDNAIKYTPKDGLIEVALVRNKNHAVLTVADNGMGIPAPLLPRIFDRFFRVDPSRSEQDGTGLGLAIAKWIAETHAATISARSREGIGTTFEVAFPLIEDGAFSCATVGFSSEVQL